MAKVQSGGMGMPLRDLGRDARIRVLTHGEDVDGVACAALLLKRFPNAEVDVAIPRRDLSGRYDVVVDLPLPRALEARLWVDHHSSTIEEGRCEEKIYDPTAPSAAGLLAGYLGLEGDELAAIADRADSASYLSESPRELGGSYDPAWDVNDAVKSLTSEERFVELAKVLASRGVAGVKEAFEEEISYTRRLRREAERAVREISRLAKEGKPDSYIILVPPMERGGSTFSGHIVFSLYRLGAKASAVFYGQKPGREGCWINVARGFEGLDASAIAERYGGGGHRSSAGAPIGAEKVEDIKREFERAGLRPIVVDLRGTKVLQNQRSRTP
ncbi:MAG: hypothetical protein NZ934_00205 [Hadesarchaea archaeon]|nr:hypothetical protein [Hadesarchaea archaeon]